MTRNEFIIHLTDQECYPDTECDSNVSQLWHCGITGESCYIPYEEYLSIITWGHIVDELRIQPPRQYDADYDVYATFRDHHKMRTVKTKQE